MSSEQHRIDGTLECREATDSPGRLVGTILPVGRVAGDRPELFIGSGVTTPSAGIALLPEHRSQTVVMRFDPLIANDGSLQVDHLLPNTPEGLALAASVRSGARPGLSIEFYPLDEARVSGVREVRQSLVTAVATVPSQSYDQAKAEVRSKSRRVAWWRRRPEVRGEAGYTETRLLEQFTRAISGNVRHGALGGLQCAASALARAFAAAEVEGDDGLLDATTLYQMGFDLVREGQSLWLLDASTGRLRLSRASTGSDVCEGAADRESWVYRLTLPGLSITTTVRASADRVIHIRQNSDPTCPWRGRSGLEVAQSSGGLAATLVHALTTEGEVPVTRIIPQPQGDSQTTAESIRKAITEGLRLALPETTMAGHGSGRASAPLTDWKPYRLGPEYMAGGVELHALALQEVASVCGLPPALAPGADAGGPALRESFRQFVAASVLPMGRILEADVSRVLERPVRLIHHELASADVAARARAFKSLVENDVDKARALELVGWAS